MRKSLLIITMAFLAFPLSAQDFTKADTLRGTLSSLRSCYDVHYYNLDLGVSISDSSIAGSNKIWFTAKNDFQKLQVDLFDNMKIDSIVFEDQQVNYRREFNAVFVDFPRPMKKGSKGHFTVYYSGKPIAAKKAPWDGGFVWKKDKNGNPFVGVACEGIGASLWWPNKDHLSDEPDSMTMSYSAPSELMCVGNGQLRNKQITGDETTWTWHVSYPINNYNVTLNIADYAHFDDAYKREDGSELALDYYVLSYNLEKAKEHFQQVKPMMKCFEGAFGKYPFPKDGYALVETPYLGMEHQSAIAYGNNYKPGYSGFYPYDMDFDYIIIHETGHEWWGNSVSMQDIADMWIHEGFCTYSEAVYVECIYGYDKMLDYLAYQRAYITNASPIIGTYGVNEEGNSTDMYYKGSWILHTLRSVMNDDEKFKSMIREIALNFKHQTTNTEEVIRFINDFTGEDYTGFFKEYLYHSTVPVLEYRYEKKFLRPGKLEFRYVANTNEFKMPVRIEAGGETVEIQPESDWKSIDMKKSVFKELEMPVSLYLIRTVNRTPEK